MRHASLLRPTGRYTVVFDYFVNNTINTCLLSAAWPGAAADYVAGGVCLSVCL